MTRRRLGLHRSENGVTFIGTGWHNGHVEGWIATIPTLGAGVVVMMAAVAGGRRRRVGGL